MVEGRPAKSRSIPGPKMSERPADFSVGRSE